MTYRLLFPALVLAAATGCADFRGKFTSDPASTVPTATTTPPATLPAAEPVVRVPLGGYGGDGAVWRACDGGFRLYIYSGGDSQRGGITAVPDPECPQPPEGPTR